MHFPIQNVHRNSFIAFFVHLFAFFVTFHSLKCIPNIINKVINKEVIKFFFHPKELLYAQKNKWIIGQYYRIQQKS